MSTPPEIYINVDYPMYKALITDIDATIVEISSNGNDIDKATIDTVRLAQSQRFKIACATGRGWPSTEPVVERLGLIDPCIIEGGSRIINPVDGKTIWEKFLDINASREVLKVFRKFAVGKELIKSTSNPDRIPIKEALEMTSKNRIIYLLGTDAEPANNIISVLVTTGLAAAYKTTPSWCGEKLYDIHVTHPDATKKNAILTWYRLTGIFPAETIGLGDSENDVSLFESVGFSVAVGNATNSLKQLANHISPTQKEGALQYVIETFLLKQ